MTKRKGILGVKVDVRKMLTESVQTTPEIDSKQVWGNIAIQ